MKLNHIHAEDYPAGEIKYRPIALLDAKVLVVLIVVPGVVFDKVPSNS